MCDTEKPYTLTYLQTDWLDPDTDGDTLLDGPDDVDHDGYANADEVNRVPIRACRICTLYWVQPFNPCLPDPLRAPARCIRRSKDPYPPFRPGDCDPGRADPARMAASLTDGRSARQ